MNTTPTQKKIAIMQAFLNGEKIEYKGYCDAIWRDVETTNPSWNWQHFEYRVKENNTQKLFIPYKNAKEFLLAMKEHGPMIKFDDKFYMPNYADDQGMSTSYDDYSYMGLLISAKWQDGTKMGNQIEM